MSTDQKSLNAAINSLEFALHPRTGDNEVLAAVHAWRRKAHGALLGQVCRDMWDKRTSDGMGLAEFREDWVSRYDELQTQVTDTIGCNIELRQQLDTANAALVACEKETRKLKTQLGKTIGGLPAVRDPDAPVVSLRGIRQPNTKFPVMHTKIVRASFGDRSWEQPGWNALREYVITGLLTDGVPFADINQHFKCVWQGPHKNYPYRDGINLTIKTRNPPEICEELWRTARAFGTALELYLFYPEKIGRTTGKREGVYASDSVFPNTEVVLHCRGATESNFVPQLSLIELSPQAADQSQAS